MKQYINKENYYKEAAMAQREILGYLQDSGESVDDSPLRHCYEFISQSLELMNAYNMDDEDGEGEPGGTGDAPSEVGKIVKIDSLLDEIEAWRNQKDGRCALVICGSRDKKGEMQIASLILGDKGDMVEALRKEYDDEDGIFAHRLELAGITSKENENKK